MEQQKKNVACKAKASSPEDSPEIRLLLVGKTGSGKSASGNTILGRREFISKTSDFSVTTECKKGEGQVNGRHVVVIDTPGLGTELPLDEVSDEVEKLIAECDQGPPHAILLVIQLGRFTDEDKRTVDIFLRRFGEEVPRCMMVLFTHGDKLEDENIKEYIEGASQELQKVVQKCGNRYHTFNNRNKDKENHTQVTELLEKIERLAAEGGGSYPKETYLGSEAKHENKSIRGGRSLSNEIVAENEVVTQQPKRIKKALEIEAEREEGEAEMQHDSEEKGVAYIAKANSPEDSPEIRLLLVGRTGSGMSASGNTILGKKEFTSKTSDCSVTTVCKKGEGKFAGRHIIVVDTPGVGTDNKPEKWITECAPGPHAILLVIEVARHSEGDRRIVETILSMFGEEVGRYMMVLFTYGDRLVDEGIEGYIQGENKELQQLVKKCGDRYHVFNNKIMSGCTQVTELLEKIDGMVKENEGRYYTRLMRLLLVGKTGSGKSASGNTILGNREFISKTSDCSVTTECKKKDREVAGRRVFVVDTPALGTDLSWDEVYRHMLDCIALCSPGPHAILLVVEVGQFTDGDKRTVDTILGRFGKEAERYVMVLFTHGDKLKDETIEEFIKGASKELQQLVEKCGNRYHVFNNKSKENHTRVPELLEKIDSMVAERGGSCNSNQMYKELKAMKNSDQENMRRVEGSLGSKMARAERREKPGLDNSEVRIMLLGEKAAGKKAVLNTILGRTEFKLQYIFQTHIKKETVQILGKTISVIKTPSWSNTDHYREVIRQCLLLLSPGPHVFLLVIKIHNTPQNKTEISLIMEELQKIFGPGVENYVMILFNNDGKLLSKSIEEYIQQVGKELEQLVQKCG